MYLEGFQYKKQLSQTAESAQYQKSRASINIKVNGSQLAKLKKSIPDMSLPWNL